MDAQLDLSGLQAAIAWNLDQLLLSKRSPLIQTWLAKHHCHSLEAADAETLLALQIDLERSLAAKDPEWQSQAIAVLAQANRIARASGHRGAAASWPPLQRWRDRHPQPTITDLEKLEAVLRGQT